MDFSGGQFTLGALIAAVATWAVLQLWERVILRRGDKQGEALAALTREVRETREAMIRIEARLEATVALKTQEHSAFERALSALTSRIEKLEDHLPTLIEHKVRNVVTAIELERRKAGDM